MTPSVSLWLGAPLLGLLAGCAVRPVNEPIKQVDRKLGYRLETRAAYDNEEDTLIILAFSGGGTRAAAFSYGVLEELRRTPVTINGHPTRMLDEVDIITGVSGGSFTALAYGLYGEKLFDTYRSERPPNDVQIILKAAGVPIDRNSYEAVELLKDMIARWQIAREVKSSGAFANAGNSALARAAANVPNIEMFAIEISFEALADAQEREYLMNLTTSFELPPEAVDRLRAAAGRIVRELPDFQALVRAMGVPSKPVSPPPLIDVR